MLSTQSQGYSNAFSARTTILSTPFPTEFQFPEKDFQQLSKSHFSPSKK
jgi:hypothetical protein